MNTILYCLGNYVHFEKLKIKVLDKYNSQLFASNQCQIFIPGTDLFMAHI